MGRPSSGRRVFGRGVGRAVLGGLDSLVRFALMDGRRGGQPTGNQLQDRGCAPWPTRSEHILDRRVSSHGTVTVVRVLYALGRPPVPDLGPRLRRAGTGVRIFLADGLRLRESLLVSLGFINHVSTLMFGNLLNIRWKYAPQRIFDHH